MTDLSYAQALELKQQKVKAMCDRAGMTIDPRLFDPSSWSIDTQIQLRESLRGLAGLLVDRGLGTTADYAEFLTED